MADTGYKTAGAIESTGNWSSFTVIVLATSDNSRAQTDDESFDAAEVSDFNFGIPEGATIVGIEVKVEYRASDSWGYPADIRVSLSHNDGTNYGDTETDSMSSTTDKTVVLGGPTSLWGHAWVYGELADGVFRLKLEGMIGDGWDADCQVDLLEVKVYYTAVTTATKTIQAKARVKFLITKTVQAKARIYKPGVVKTIQAKAKIYNPLPRIEKVVLVSPTHQTSGPSPATLVWEIPETREGEAVHAHIQIDKTSGAFGDIEFERKSWESQANMEYWDGDSWEPYPAAGVDQAYKGNQARITGVTLTQGDKWWRVRGALV